MSELTGRDLIGRKVRMIDDEGRNFPEGVIISYRGDLEHFPYSLQMTPNMSISCKRSDFELLPGDPLKEKGEDLKP